MFLKFETNRTCATIKCLIVMGVSVVTMCISLKKTKTEYLTYAKCTSCLCFETFAV